MRRRWIWLVVFAVALIVGRLQWQLRFTRREWSTAVRSWRYHCEDSKFDALSLVEWDVMLTMDELETLSPAERERYTRLLRPHRIASVLTVPLVACDLDRSAGQRLAEVIIGMISDARFDEALELIHQLEETPLAAWHVLLQPPWPFSLLDDRDSLLRARPPDR